MRLERHALHFGIDQLRRLLRDFPARLDIATEEQLLFDVTHQDRSDGIGESPLRHVATGDAGRLLNVAGRSRGHTVVAEHDFFSGTSTVRHDQLRLELLAGDRYAVILGERERDTKGATARHDGDFVQRIVAVHHHRAHRVSGFVKRGKTALFIFHHQRLTLGAQHDAIFRFLEIAHVDLVVTLPGREQGAFVHEIREVGAGHARRTARQRMHAHVVCLRLVAQVHLENAFTAAEVRRIDDDLTVETTRTQQRGIEHVRTIRGGDQNDAVVRLEAVHFHKQLIERLLAFVVTTTHA